MPRRPDIHKVLIIGSGPIVIGQACEFDYSGTQACKALRRLGYEIVLVNSNPATIMTDPVMADETYIEPLNAETLAEVIAVSKPDALLPNLGGQSGLNLSSELYRSGTLDNYGVSIIGVRPDAIERGEDRLAFKETMTRLGIDMPRSEICYSVDQAAAVAAELGYPVVIRPAYTMGGTGRGLVYNREELQVIVERGIRASLVGQVLVEESVLGWEELELEVVRDAKNQMITVCFIENVDAMGVHTGDSYCTAPMLTISPDLQQRLQKYSYAIVEAIEVIGGTNIQFAHDPKTGRVVVIEINPRTSRSSALASKATGFPIAMVSSLLAGGLTLDEIPYWRDGTLEKYTPSGDYVVVKFARWAFEKFRDAQDKLGTQMRAVGEVMSIGKNYKESLQKAIRSLETGRYGLGFAKDFNKRSLEELLALLKEPTSERQFIMYEALRKGAATDVLYARTHIKPWFIEQMRELVRLEEEILAWRATMERAQEPGTQGQGARGPGTPAEGPQPPAGALPGGALPPGGAAADVATRTAPSAGSLPADGAAAPALPDDLLTRAKKDGFADAYLAKLTGLPEAQIRAQRLSLGLRHGYDAVPVSGVEDAAYYYSTYNAPDAVPVSDRRKIMVLGGGPNRIGQGIEFDYCCVHAAFALREAGFESIMVNCNPETVSTDYDTSDKLYFEPLTVEDVLAIYEKERPEGVIVQFGGQTPLNIARELEKAGVPIIGTSPETIDLAEDRDRFRRVMERLGIPMPEAGMATSVDEARVVAERIGYPVIARPSYVLGGRGMEIIHDEEMLTRYVAAAVNVTPERPILIDRFLENAMECEADALSDGVDAFVPAVMQHIEYAGVHSGDSACVIPPVSIPEKHLATINEYTKRIAVELGVVGLMNMQYAILDDVVYVLEANPRASRTVPLVSKVCNVQMAALATRLMLGEKLADLGLEHAAMPYFGVKEAVFPFNMFPEVDPLLGPEMRSTGEVLGMGDSFGLAFAKAEEAAGQRLPLEGTVLITVAERDRQLVLPAARAFYELGFKIRATVGTHAFLAEQGIQSEPILKLHEGRPNIEDAIKNGEINLVVNTPAGKSSEFDDSYIRKAAIRYKVPYITTTTAATAAAGGIAARRAARGAVRSLQSYHSSLE
ncbi:MAG: carbamoyl-phosphate synthase large subunit [Actinomycetia bacterium]|nr:carbamoyl-phosphate synthase large subunit [Actinomycetes bacterium]